MVSKPAEGELRRVKRPARCIKGANATTVVGSSNPGPSERLSFTSTAIALDARRPASRPAGDAGCGEDASEVVNSSQATFATSSGDAEYNALVRGGAEASEAEFGRAGLGDAHRH